MTSLIKAITTDYDDYVAFCESVGTIPLELDSQPNFYESREWRAIERRARWEGGWMQNIEAVVESRQ